MIQSKPKFGVPFKLGHREIMLYTVRDRKRSVIKMAATNALRMVVPCFKKRKEKKVVRKNIQINQVSE